MKLFMGERAECHHCHGSFIFNDQANYVGAPVETPRFHNTGLYNLAGTGGFPEPNRGVFELTGRARDMGAFKAPSLRNVALTAPYMHDGSIPTLAAAIDHYAAGGRIIADGPFAGDGRTNPYKDPLIAGHRTQPAANAPTWSRSSKTLTDRTRHHRQALLRPLQTHTKGPTMKRLFAALATAAAISAVTATTAFAHVEYKSSSPGKGKTASTRISTVTVTFTGPLRKGTLKVTGPGGKSVNDGAGARDPRNISRLRVPLKSGLKAGSYKATWSITAADGHKQSGSFTFKLK